MPKNTLDKKLASRKKVTVTEPDPDYEQVMDTFEKKYNETYERYIKDRYSTVTVRFDKFDSGEAEIFAYLDSQPNKTKYIMNLIKNDMLGLDIPKQNQTQKIKINLEGFINSDYYKEHIAEIEALTDKDEKSGF